MKETEILDIVLRGLYEYRSSHEYKAPRELMPDLTLDDEIRIAHWLEQKGLVKLRKTNAYYLKLTSNGVMYCEDDSQSQPGSPITSITFVQNINSPGSNIQISILGQVLYPNVLEIQKQLDQLRNELDSQTHLTENMISEIGECLDEISTKVEDRKPVPEFFWKWLGRIADGTSLITSIDSLRHIIQP